MKGEVIIRQAEAGNLLEIESLLQEARLPTAGLESHVAASLRLGGAAGMFWAQLRSRHTRPTPYCAHW